MSSKGSPIEWVVLTMGNRPDAVRQAVASLMSNTGEQAADQVILVCNGSSSDVAADFSELTVVESKRNLGVPGGRDYGLSHCSAAVVGFLDDDAELLPGATDLIRAAFEAEPLLGAISMRLVDENGDTSRRHIPRLGKRGADDSSEVALFLGGACAIRRSAYEDVGGYFADLFYGHEEVEFCWRLIDGGWNIRYLADAVAYHPRTEVSRHVDGWRLTGRNRVWIARRTLPWLVAIPHVLAWLLLGLWRAPRGQCRRSYLSGWWSGWSGRIDRRPISWSGVWRLTALRRPPII